MLAVEVLAHQGGWDEILMVAAPIALFVVLLKTANRRNAVDQPPAGQDPQDPDQD